MIFSFTGVSNFIVIDENVGDNGKYFNHDDYIDGYTDNNADDDGNNKNDDGDDDYDEEHDDHDIYYTYMCVSVTNHYFVNIFPSN